jgi:hypothetical protein
MITAATRIVVNLHMEHLNHVTDSAFTLSPVGLVRTNLTGLFWADVQC